MPIFNIHVRVACLQKIRYNIFVKCFIQLNMVHVFHNHALKEGLSDEYRNVAVV